MTTRFSTPEEVVHWARSAATDDLKYAAAGGVDINPYSTPGRRSDWSRGYFGLGPRSYESAQVLLYDAAYQRGAACAALQKENHHGIA